MSERTILRIPARVAYLAQGVETAKHPETWWIRFEGSQERMFAGGEKPDCNVGDMVFIDIVKPKPSEPVSPPLPDTPLPRAPVEKASA